MRAQASQKRRIDPRAAAQLQHAVTRPDVSAQAVMHQPAQHPCGRAVAKIGVVARREGVEGGGHRV
ncbi:MAG: hypothetical protein MUC99_06005 [Anaerolineae bacterium]|nr:hypothetical protein [Anaerolineae bacterium]